MQISLRFIKRFLMSVVFVATNSVYATDLNSAGSFAAAEAAVASAPATSSLSGMATVPQDSQAEGPVTLGRPNVDEVPGSGVSQARRSSDERRPQEVAVTNTSGVDCVSSPNPKSKDDDANKADCSSAGAIDRAVLQLTSLKTKNSESIKVAHKTFTNKWGSCVKVQSRAAFACLENLSPAISGAAGPIGLLFAAGSGASSANGSCDTVGKIMQIANSALTVYNTACSAAKASCAISCNGAVAALGTINKLNEENKCLLDNDPACLGSFVTAKENLSQALKKELNTQNTLSMAGKKKLCDGKYVELGISALGGIAAVVMAMGQADECKKNTAAAKMDCKLAKYAQTPSCLCEANPRLQGCANGLDKVGSASLGNGSMGTITGAMRSSESSMPGIGGGEGGIAVERDPAAAGGAGVASGGAGAANLGGSGLSGGGGGADGGGVGGRQGYDTNILGSPGGGGGGGSSRGFSAGASSKLGAYLPGGEKDPSKLNGGSWANEVTGQGGKSNWEKVRERYRDNKTSLFNN